MKEIIMKLISELVKLLPLSPFPDLIKGLHETLHPYLGYLNYFVPMKQVEAVLLAWLGAVAVWYTWRALASWLHLIS